MIDKELLMILIITNYTFFYPLGGWKFKVFRREVAPIIGALLMFKSGYIWWKCLIYAVAQDGVFRLPYGDKTPLGIKVLVGCCFSIPTMIFGFTIWQAIVPMVFLITFFLSNWRKSSAAFTWKICESIVGFLIGVILAKLIGG